MIKRMVLFITSAIMILVFAATSFVFGQSGSGMGWTAQYFNNTDLSGTPVYTETLPGGINFNWGADSPNALVVADNFSARFTSAQAFTQGTYEFIVSSDDGVRVYIDNVLVLDHFIGRVLTTDRFQWALADGMHTLTVEYVEFIDQAAIQFEWLHISDEFQTPTPACNYPPPDPGFNTWGMGWTAQYFNNVDLAGTPVYTEILPGGINFNWGSDSPNALIPADNFSARFTSVQLFTQGTYEFIVSSDDGVRVYIDNVLVLDRFVGRVLTTDRFQQTLTAGSHSLTVEYVEFIDQAAVQFQWFSISQVTCGTPEPAETFLAENLANVTNNAITASGGVGNVGENNQGNTYSRTIAVNGTFLRNPGEIGLQGLIDRGVLQAVDLFGMLPGGASVVPFNNTVHLCLKGDGDLIFLSAADEPRVPTEVTAVFQDGYTCGDVPGSGTVVLINALGSIETETPVP